jgi:hypothetical protein
MSCACCCCTYFAMVGCDILVHYAGAHQSWFHLYELVQPPADDGIGAVDDEALSTVGTALEQFMQTATLGEYSARLALLASFQRHASMQVNSGALSHPIKEIGVQHAEASTCRSRVCLRQSTATRLCRHMWAAAAQRAGGRGLLPC